MSTFRHVLALSIAVGCVALFAVAFVAEADGITHSYPRHTAAIALTFDDGPDPKFTPQILDALADYDARATFFVIGEHAQRHPELIARMLAEGHEVAHHTHTHPHVDRIDAAEVARQMDECLDALAAQGVRPVWYRPPRKKLTSAQQDAAEARGMGIALWSRCLERDRFESAEDAAATLAEETCAGEIVLAHDGLGDRTQTVLALPLYLSALEARGVEVLTLSELSQRSNP